MTESAVECSSMGNSRRPFFFCSVQEREGKGEREGGTGGFRGGGLVLECMAAGSEDTPNLFDTSTILRVSASCLASPELGAGRVTGSDLLRVFLFGGTAASRSGTGTYAATPRSWLPLTSERAGGVELGRASIALLDPNRTAICSPCGTFND